ncbi:MAG: UvrD-helicase domain-containing protein, partial [Clostridia bacterium]|nr:UvrD-helicase domain-containing protein [Clostridia bacterium]
MIDTLRQEAMRDTLDDFFTRDDRDFVTLADTLAVSRDTEALDRTLLSIYAQITAAGEEPAALAEYGRKLAEGGDFFAMPQSEPVKNRVRAAVSHYRRVFTSLRNDFDETVEKQYGPAAQGDLDWLDRLEAALEGGEYGQIRAMFGEYVPVKLGRLAAKDATEESEAFKTARNGLKNEIARLADSFFADPAELAADSISRTASLLVTCSRVLTAYAETFRSRKMSRSLLDYGDLEALALRLFIAPDGTPTEAALETGRQFSYIFVDEYQDTNRVQDAIFRALGAEVPRFMVGDSKQSIYRFRGAEPSVFARYRDRWGVQDPVGEAVADTADSSFSPEDGRCLFMSENFRCDRPVVDFVNLVSDYLFPQGSMPYTAEDALVFGKGESEDTAAEIVLIEKPAAGEDEEESPAALSDAEPDPEAEYVAERIAELLSHGQTGGRAYTPDDFAILLRSPDTNGAAFRQSLLKRGIPVRLPGGEYLFGSPVVLLTMCLLHTADNPLYDIPAAGAMHSPLFGFATHELVLLREWSRQTMEARYHWDGDVPLYYIVQMAADPDWEFSPENPVQEETAHTDVGTDASAQPEMAGTQLVMGETPAEEAVQDSMPWDWDPVENCMVPEEAKELPDPLPEDLVEKCRVFRDAVHRLREMACGMRADRFLDELFRHFSLFDLPEVRDNPVEKSNLHTLYDLARRYESGAFGGIGGFLTYAEELQDQKQSGQSENDSLPAVSILSIHKSKGLEYPVVFVSACSKRRNARDEMGDILFDADLGFGMRLPDTGGYARCGTALRSSIGEKKRLESVEEEMRVVYVALTRARNRLIVTGKVKDAETFAEDCRTAARFATPYSVTGNCTMLQWILQAALSHGPDPCWRLLTVDTASEVTEDTAEVPEEAPAPENWDELLAGNMDFVYPLSYLAKVPAKLTVSGLSEGILDEDAAPLRLSLDPTDGAVQDPDPAEALSADTPSPAPERTPMPRFMTETPGQMSSAERGTATHMFLQFADFGALAEHGVEAELTRLVE